MKISIVYFLLCITPLQSFASSLFLEPSIGYRSENLKLTDFSQKETQFKSSLPVYGLKLGVRSQMGVDLNLAADYSKGKMEVTALTEKNDFTHQTASAQLGVNALGLVKIYLGYGFFNELKIEDSSQLTGFKLTGASYLAGLQFKLFPYVMIGAQYNLNQFKKIEGVNYVGNDSIDKYFSKVDIQDYSLLLAFSF